jgi:hypothetical protein
MLDSENNIPARLISGTPQATPDGRITFGKRHSTYDVSTHEIAVVRRSMGWRILSSSAIQKKCRTLSLSVTNW